MLMLKTKTMVVSVVAVLKFSSPHSLSCVMLYSITYKFLLLHESKLEKLYGYFRICNFSFQLIVDNPDVVC